MIKKIIQYPTVTSLEFDGIVRHFDDTLHTLIQDLKDTLSANSLDALAAYQIGSPSAVIVIKQDDNSFLEIINPIIIKKEGETVAQETTAYFPGLTAKTQRYKKIRMMYENAKGEQQFLTAEGDLAITIQRKTDYLLGSNFRIRMDEEEKKHFDAKLNYGTNKIDNNTCPTVFKRDKILFVIKYGLIAGVIGILLSFFLNTELLQTIILFENYLMGFLLFLILVYFFYAQYEGKKYTNCMSCQIGNIAGTAFIKTIHLTLLFLANYFIVY